MESFEAAWKLVHQVYFDPGNRHHNRHCSLHVYQSKLTSVFRSQHARIVYGPLHTINLTNVPAPQHGRDHAKQSQMYTLTTTLDLLGMFHSRYD